MTTISDGPLAQTKEDTMKKVDVSELRGPLTELMEQVGGQNGRTRFDEFKLWLKGVMLVPEPPSESVLDFTVHVDRSIKPTYPDWMKKVMHPELELAGPAEYDLLQIDQWLHDDQRSSVVGNTIYKYLQKVDALTTCLNLQDGLAIQQKGITVFRKLFTGKAVFLWGSVVQHRVGNLRVPYLIEDVGKVLIHWRWVGYSWDSDLPALRFRK